MPQLSPDCLALQTSLSCPLDPRAIPFICPFCPIVGFLWAVSLHGGCSAGHPSIGVIMLSFQPLCGLDEPHHTPASCRSQSQVTAEQAAADDTKGPRSAHPSLVPGSSSTCLPDCSPVTHPVATGECFPEPYPRGSRNHCTFQTQSLSHCLLLPSGDLSEQDLKGQVSTTGRCSGHISHP